MLPTRRLLLASLLATPLLLAPAPARALIGLDIFSFSPASGSGTPDGACPGPTSYSCYENLSASGVSIIGALASSGQPTLFYTLPAVSQTQTVNLNYVFSPNGNSDSVAIIQVGTTIFSLGSGGTDPYSGSLSFQWDPNSILQFTIEQNLDTTWTGELTISNFSSNDINAVPAPLPIGGSIALMAWSRALRRRIRSAHHHPPHLSSPDRLTASNRRPPQP